MVGIRDIASHLNISVASVSRALNGHPYVNEDVRNSVVNAARLLGYKPKQSGRSLRTGMSNTVGFMIETHPSNPQHVDNFLISILDAVQSVFRPNGLTLVALPCSADQNPAEYVQEIIERRFIDGMILTSTKPKDERVRVLKAAATPFVTLGRTADFHTHAWIDLDFEGFAVAAVHRLYNKGHRRIAVMLPRETLNFGRITLKGYKKALKDLGLVFDPTLVVPVTPDASSGYSACAALFESEYPPTAALLIHEALAPGVYDCLRGRDLVPGLDFGVISLNDCSEVRLSPELTRFRFDTKKVGLALAEMLLGQMNDHSSDPEHKQALVPFEILDGNSEGHSQDSWLGMFEQVRDLNNAAIG